MDGPGWDGPKMAHRWARNSESAPEMDRAGCTWTMVLVLDSQDPGYTRYWLP